jgi:hypothetical protein
MPFRKSLPLANGFQKDDPLHHRKVNFVRFVSHKPSMLLKNSCTTSG